MSEIVESRVKHGWSLESGIDLLTRINFSENFHTGHIYSNYIDFNIFFTFDKNVFFWVETFLAFSQTF